MKFLARIFLSGLIAGSLSLAHAQDKDPVWIDSKVVLSTATEINFDTLRTSTDSEGKVNRVYGPECSVEITNTEKVPIALSLLTWDLAKGELRAQAYIKYFDDHGQELEEGVFTCDRTGLRDFAILPGETVKFNIAHSGAINIPHPGRYWIRAWIMLRDEQGHWLNVLSDKVAINITATAM